jgi:hypothetical protein
VISIQSPKNNAGMCENVKKTMQESFKRNDQQKTGEKNVQPM